MAVRSVARCTVRAVKVVQSGRRKRVKWAAESSVLRESTLRVLRLPQFERLRLNDA